MSKNRKIMVMMPAGNAAAARCRTHAEFPEQGIADHGIDDDSRPFYSRSSHG